MTLNARTRAMAMKSMRDAPDAQGGFNDNHKRQILLTLGYVDKLLSDALRELSAAGMLAAERQVGLPTRGAIDVEVHIRDASP